MKNTEHQIWEFATGQWGDKTLAEIGLKLGEESGEVQGVIVKIDEQRKSFDDIRDEVGDVLIVLSQLAFNLDATLEELRARRFEQIKARAERVPCAACDRDDFQLGHADNCPKK